MKTKAKDHVATDWGRATAMPQNAGTLGIAERSAQPLTVLAAGELGPSSYGIIPVACAISLISQMRLTQIRVTDCYWRITEEQSVSEGQRTRYDRLSVSSLFITPHL